jgi:hypothetical protein
MIILIARLLGTPAQITWRPFPNRGYIIFQLSRINENASAKGLGGSIRAIASSAIPP